MADLECKLDLIISGMRSAAWEEAQGALRKAYMAVGATTPSYGDDRWMKFRDRAEAFIKGIDEDGLAE